MPVRKAPGGTPPSLPFPGKKIENLLVWIIKGLGVLRIGCKNNAISNELSALTLRPSTEREELLAG